MSTETKAGHTPGPWHLCFHLQSIENDRSCPCGQRGVVYGPEHDVATAVCEMGVTPAPGIEAGTEPMRYPREVELANARLIAAAPDLLAACEAVQWGGTERDEDGAEYAACPCCGEPREMGHLPGCKLEAALAKARA